MFFSQKDPDLNAVELDKNIWFCQTQYWILVCLVQHSATLSQIRGLIQLRIQTELEIMAILGEWHWQFFVQ